MRDAATRLPRAHQGPPGWARLGAPVAVLLMAAVTACAASGDPDIDTQGAAPGKTSTTVERTTTTERPTTTTTRPPTTTVPPTTVPPTTAPPPPPPTAPPTTAPPPPPAPPSDCNPNYTPCLPNVGDLNCPDVGGPVTVIGGDPYGLDRDNDGIGCE